MTSENVKPVANDETAFTEWAGRVMTEWNAGDPEWRRAMAVAIVEAMDEVENEDNADLPENEEVGESDEHIGFCASEIGFVRHEEGGITFQLRDDDGNVFAHAYVSPKQALEMATELQRAVGEETATQLTQH